MKRFLFSAESLPFWGMAAAVLALLLFERSSFVVWSRVRHYLLTAPFLYQSLVLYLVALLLALLTYRDLYNVKVLLAGFLFLVMGVFSMHYLVGFEVPWVDVERIPGDPVVHWGLYALYGADLLLLALIPAYLPKASARLSVALFVLAEGVILFACRNGIPPCARALIPVVEERGPLVLFSLYGTALAAAHMLSFRRRDPYAWPITAFLLLFSVAYGVRGTEKEVLLLHLTPAALALMVLANLTASLSHHARYDPLLNIYNRGYCNRLLQGKARSLGRRFALVLFDLDHFKKINDRHGHAAGDRVLYAVAQKVREKALPRGVTCRYGGEEILVVFPGASIGYAEKVGREIVASVSRMRIPAAARRKAPLRVTVSAGVAAGRAGKDDAMAVLEAADRALYRAKRSGRNRLHVVRRRA